MKIVISSCTFRVELRNFIKGQNEESLPLQVITYILPIVSITQPRPMEIMSMQSNPIIARIFLIPILN